VQLLKLNTSNLEISLMSIPFIQIGCTECDFRGDTLTTFGCYLWQHEGNVFQFERQLGLCLDCNKVVAVEQLPSSETMEQARAIRRTYNGKPLLRFLEKDDARYLASQTHFEILEAVCELRRLPVCLECGNSAIRQIELPRQIYSDTKVSLGLKHPWCEGTLEAQSSGGLRMGLTPITYTYDIYGHLLSMVNE
jgi:hypothetical protein